MLIRNRLTSPTVNLTANALFYGDNLDILRNHIATNTIDLIHTSLQDGSKNIHASRL
jgi:hypothetical protein